MSIVQLLIGAWERRQARRKVDWRDCIWSPKKAAEKRLRETLAEHYREMFRLQTEAQLRQLAEQMSAAQILRAATHAQNERALREYRLQYEIARKRMGDV